MVLEKNILAISIPFSAGVAMMAAMPSGIEMPLHAAALTQLAAVSMLFIACLSRRSYHVIPILFFILGVNCYLNSMSFPVQEREQWEPVSRALSWLISRIDSLGLEDENGALMKALLTGNKSWIGDTTTEAFRKSGASHILALSGLHLGIIYGILRKALTILGNSRAAFLCRSVVILCSCSFYSAMTGAGASVTRALIFIILNEVSSLLPGRKRIPSNVFLTAMMIQLALNPQVIKTLAFQLSYLAMAGIMTVYPSLKAWFPGKNGSSYPSLLWDSISMSVSCQVFTAPLIWIHFGTFPSFFLLTNLIALPLAESYILLSVVLVSPLTPQWVGGITKSLAEQISQTLIYSMEIISSLT